MSQSKLNRRKPQLSKSLCAAALAFSMLARMPPAGLQQPGSRWGW